MKRKITGAEEAEIQAIINERDLLRHFAQKAYTHLDTSGDSIAAYLSLQLALGIDAPPHKVGERWWEKWPYKGRRKSKKQRAT